MSDQPDWTRGQMTGMDFRLHHVGFAVRDIKTTSNVLASLFGFQVVSEIVAVEGEAVRVCFVATGQGFWIELVEPASSQSPVSRLTERSGASPYHVCYQVEHLDAALTALRKKKCRILRRFSIELSGRQQHFAYLMARDGQLIELGQISLPNGHPLKLDGI